MDGNAAEIEDLSHDCGHMVLGQVGVLKRTLVNISIAMGWKAGTVDPIGLVTLTQLATVQSVLEVARELRAQREDFGRYVATALDYWKAEPDVQLERAAIAAHHRAVGPSVDEFNALIEALQRRCDQLRDHRDQLAALLAEIAPDNERVGEALALFGLQPHLAPQDAPSRTPSEPHDEPRT